MQPDQTLLTHAYGRRVELDLPNGNRLVAKPLDFETALRFLELLETAQEMNDLGAIRTIAKEFPEAIQAGAQLRGLTMVELFDVVRFFITSRPTTNSSSSDSSEKRPGMTPPGSSPSPISSPTTPAPTADHLSQGFRGPSSSSSPASSVEPSPGSFMRL